VWGKGDFGTKRRRSFTPSCAILGSSNLCLSHLAFLKKVEPALVYLLGYETSCELVTPSKQRYIQEHSRLGCLLCHLQRLLQSTFTRKEDKSRADYYPIKLIVFKPTSPRAGTCIFRSPRVEVSHLVRPIWRRSFAAYVDNMAILGQ
jgi:hypothetical protein